jgi:hypothetical protein
LFSVYKNEENPPIQELEIEMRTTIAVSALFAGLSMMTMTDALPTPAITNNFLATKPFKGLPVGFPIFTKPVLPITKQI